MIRILIARVGEVVAEMDGASPPSSTSNGACAGVGADVGVGDGVGAAGERPPPPHFHTTATAAATTIIKELLRTPSHDSDREGQPFFRPGPSRWQVIHVHEPLTSTSPLPPMHGLGAAMKISSTALSSLADGGVTPTASGTSTPTNGTGGIKSAAAVHESAANGYMERLMRSKLMTSGSRGTAPVAPVAPGGGGGGGGRAAAGGAEKESNGANQRHSEEKLRVLLLGAGGFLGPHLIDVLSPDRYTVTASDVPHANRGNEPDTTVVWREQVLSKYQREGRLESLIPLDICDGAAVATAAANADVIVNCAVTRYDPVLTWRVNCLGTLHAVRAAVQCGHTRFVNTGPLFAVTGWGYLERFASSTEIYTRGCHWFHACSIEASRRVANGIPFGCPLLLPVRTANCVQTLKDYDDAIHEDTIPQPGVTLYALTKSCGHEITRIYTLCTPSLHVMNALYCSFYDSDPTVPGGGEADDTQPTDAGMMLIPV
jgi:hypothetical protein